jgi:Ser/Thr protein kinase RdoA (MazF antagonist)
MSWFTEKDGYLQQLETISRYFCLGHVLEAQRMGGHANKNYVVTTPQGAFVLKILLNHPRAVLEQEQIYLKRLEEYAFPAAYALQTPHGSFCYQDEHLLAIALQKKEGGIPEKSEQVNRELGVWLARLHLLPTDGLPPKTSWMNPFYLSEALEGARQHLDEAFVAPFFQVYETIRHFQPALLPQSIIHGDVVPANCLYFGTQLVALLDWEEVTVGASLFDLAMSLLMFCFVKRQFQPNFSTALLNGYTAIRPLTTSEYDQLEVAVKYIGLTISTYFLLQFMVYHPDEQLAALCTFYWDYHLDTWTIR